MNVTMRAATRSGSLYVLDDRGDLTVTRRAGHPLPQRERVAVESIQRLAGPKGCTVLCVRPLDGTSFMTSALANATLPPCLRTVNGTWLRSEQVAKPAATTPSKALDMSTWAPASTRLPEGLAAAMAVYGE